MRIVALAAAVALTVASQASALDLGDTYGTVTVGTDYRQDGISLTQNDPYVEGELGLNDGFLYAGVNGRSINPFPGGPYLELTGFAGVTPTWAPTSEFSLGLDFGAEYHAFYGTPAGLPDLDYWDFHAGAGATVWILDVTGEVSYSPDYIGGTGASWAYEAGASTEFYDNGETQARFFGTAGQRTIDDLSGTPMEDWIYYEVGAGVTYHGIDFSVAYTDTDLDASLFGPFANSVDGGVVARVSWGF